MSVTMPINPDTLKWARTVSRLTHEDVARAASIKNPNRIAEFEAGEAMPTRVQLAKIAKKLDRTPAFFFIETPDRSDVPTTVDFRGNGDPDLSATTVKQIRNAERRRQHFIDISENLTNPTKVRRINQENADQRATELRHKLGLKTQTLPPSSNAHQVFSFWRNLIEEHGYLIFQTSGVSSKEFRGLSIDHELIPIIILNGNDSPRSRAFTIFHEIAHLCNRTSGVCHLEETSSEEFIANAFAASFLMPKDELWKAIDRCSEPDYVQEVSRHFRVSTIAAAIRLNKLGIISSERTDRERQHSIEAWAIQQAKQKMSKGFVPHYRLVAKNLGPRYIQAVADAIDDRRINHLDAAYMTDTRIPTLEKILSPTYRDEDFE